MYALIIGKNGTEQTIKNVTGFEASGNVLKISFFDAQGNQFVDRELNMVQGIIFGQDEVSRRNLSTAVSGSIG